MTYQYEDTPHRHDPADPYARSGIRPHEFPSRGDAGTGGLALAGALVAIVALVVIVIAFSGADTTAPAEDGAATAPATAPATDG